MSRTSRSSPSNLPAMLTSLHCTRTNKMHCFALTHMIISTQKTLDKGHSMHKFYTKVPKYVGHLSIYYYLHYFYCQKTAGWIGFGSNSVSYGSAVLLSRLSDRFKRQIPLILKVLTAVSILSNILIVFIQQQFIVVPEHIIIGKLKVSLLIATSI